MMKNDRGHTLIELMVVLLIFSICLAIPTLYYVNRDSGQDVKAFIEEFEQDLYYSQQQAMGKTTNARINIFNGRGFYQVSVDGKHEKTVHFPEGLRFQRGSIAVPTPIFFYPNGNTNVAGRFAIQTPGDLYWVNFRVGSGRFYVERLHS
ncbi:competence protein ComGD [Geomicrobium halophilum]|uniref:Competence protein ComGD n=1 Tax=Geomicrobium halophilum TaxID=549000 RepID=A0A841Q0G6_9BACL|nr:competence type IV pilus minor pilin ComGD [Geomicrobium halophilum]MBB6448888.1 competence protein ComGD [Geomicrobium halophilum]